MQQVAEKKPRHAPADGGTLTPKQRAFLTLYASGKFANATAAAVAAGYSPRSARGSVYDLLRHPRIRNELDAIAERVRERTAYDATACFEEAGAAVAFAKEKGNANAFVKAIELRARIHGLLVDRQQIDVVMPDISAALAEARARLVRVDNRPLPAPSLPMRCQADASEADFRVLPHDEGREPSDN